MPRRSALLLAATLAACDTTATTPGPVLTLLPRALAGGSLRGEQLCLAPGEQASAAVYVHEPSVTFTVRGVADGETMIDVALGPEALARHELQGATPLELTYRARPPRGTQALRLSVPREAGATLCLTEIALSQP